MDPESKQLLKSILELTEENNRMLHKVRGVQRREAIWLGLKILVIIGIAFGSLYILEPYINKVVDFYESAMKVEQDVSNLLKN